MAKHVITPGWQTSRGPLVRASGCAVGVPVAGARVFGETRQNLWQNPIGTNNGVTATEMDDGALKLSGTASGFVSIVVETFALKPSTAYTLSVDKEPGTKATATLNIREKRADGSNIDLQHNASTGGVAFTTSADMASCECRLVVISGATVSGTYRVMLNEGPTAEPWCPPGLSSVSELGIVAAGKNLVEKIVYGYPSSAADQFTVENNSISVIFSAVAGTEYVFSASAAPDRKIYGYVDTANVVSGTKYLGYNEAVLSDGKIKLTPNESGIVYLYVSSSKNDAIASTAQVELGTQATSYEPPAVSTTPVDLAGHQLRSLPDGTRDVLTVDGSGAVSVEQAVECVTYDGSSDETGSIYESQYGHFFHLTLPGNIGGDAPGADTGAILCDTLPVNKSDVANSKTGIWFLKDYRSAVYVKPPVDLASFEDFRSWLTQHPVTVIYPGATPQTVHLDPIAPPSIPASDATLWAASDVPCDLEATTWTASGAEQGRQQAAMVKVAQQVRQQAETVAALTTQALEA